MELWRTILWKKKMYVEHDHETISLRCVGSNNGGCSIGIRSVPIALDINLLSRYLYSRMSADIHLHIHIYTRFCTRGKVRTSFQRTHYRSIDPRVLIVSPRLMAQSFATSSPFSTAIELVACRHYGRHILTSPNERRREDKS